ncbi:MAG: cbb3-type cytochrome c oxidase subunit I [Verrucomicrobiota bacterium]
MPSALYQTSDQDIALRAAIDRSTRHPVMFFFTSGSAWLAVSIILGILPAIKMGYPEFLSAWGFLNYGRLFSAHMNALVYGWGMQAAFAAIIWLMARMSRKTCTAVGVILTAGHVWNFALSLGIIGILCGYGTGVPLMELPVFVWPVLLVCYILIVIWSFIQFRVRQQEHVYITQWYILAAMIWFPWIYLTANVLVFCMDGHPLMAAGVNAWFHSTLVYLFFVPVGLGTAYYLSSKVTGRSVFSYRLTQLGFWILAIAGPWTGLQKLTGAPIPFFMPYLSAAATAVLFIPLAAAAMNNIQTMLSNRETLVGSPSLRFNLAGMFAMILVAAAGVILNIPGYSLNLTQFSISGYGFDVLAIYGSFSLVMFAAAYFIVPRVTLREWVSRRVIGLHFLFTCYGVGAIAAAAIFGGLLQGQGMEMWREPWRVVGALGNPYFVLVSIAWCFILFANLFFFTHLTLMWLRLGRRSSHPTLLAHGHSSSPHGEEGDIDNAGPGHLPVH